MRIVVVDFAATLGGATSILKAFYQYLIESKDCDEWIFLLSDKHIQETDNIKIVLLKKEKYSWFRRLAFDFAYGRTLIRRLDADAVFYLQNTLIYGVKIPQIMYMDQSISFQKEKRFRFTRSEERVYAVYQHIIGALNHAACRHADRTIVQTRWLKEAIIDQCRIGAERIFRIPPSISELCYWYHAEKVNQREFFYPASSAVYKNHQCIYDALSKISADCKVVLTLDGKENMPPQCQFTGSMTQDEVCAQMARSVLVFPSYIESYGLPLKEARTIGTLILAADTSFAREILDGYKNAYFFDPFLPDALAELMRQVMDGTIIHIPQEKQCSAEQHNPWADVVRVIRGEL